MRALTQREARLGVDFAAVLVTGSVAVALAALTWHLLGHSGIATPVPVTAAPLAPSLDLGAVKAFAPFGIAAPTPIAGAAGDPSTLGLQLRGVMLARPQSASTALISVGTGPAVAYAAGMTLPGGAVLDGIEYDLVTLRVNGALQTLAFPVKPGGGAPPAASPAPAVALPAIPRPGDPRGLLESLGATPGADGYRIGATLAPAMRAAGLQPGDLVAKVNGVALGDVNQDKRVFDAAVAAGYARVEVVRDGKRIALSFPLQ